MRPNPNRDRVYRHCGCRNEHGRQLGARCPQLANRCHGNWAFAVDMPSLDRGRTTMRRDGYDTRSEARAALARVLDPRPAAATSPWTSTGRVLRAHAALLLQATGMEACWPKEWVDTGYVFVRADGTPIHPIYPMQRICVLPLQCGPRRGHAQTLIPPTIQPAQHAIQIETARSAKC